MAKIIVVDDCAPDRLYLAKLLRNQNHTIFEAADGADALDKIAAVQPELAISDLFIPKIDGFEFARRLRSQETAHAIPLVFCTASYLARQVEELARELGVWHILSKPVQPEELVRIVDLLLQRPRRSDGERPISKLTSDDVAAFHERTLEEVNARWEAVIAFHQELSEETNPSLVLEQSCRAARKILGVRGAFIVANDIYADERERHVASGFGRQPVAELARFLTSQAMFTRMISSGRPYRIVYRFGELPLPIDVRPVGESFGLLATPIFGPSRSYGWLCLIDKIGCPEFTEADERLAAALSAQVGRTYENCSLFAETQQHTQKLNKEIAERRHAEAELDRFFTQSPNPLGLVGFDGRFIRVNPAHETTFGYSASELRQERFINLVHPDDRANSLAEVRKMSEGHGQIAVENRIRCKDGSYKSMIWYATPFHDLNGFYATGYDITERKRLEQQLQQAQKMDAIGALAGGVAHDFNNLLTVITGYSDVALEQLSAKDGLRGFVDEIRKAGERAASLTRQLLLFSRKQICTPSAINFASLLAEMTRMLSRLIGEDIELQLAVAPNLWRIKADQGQMEQVVMNLIVNARDAMPKGGRIVVEATNVELDGDGKTSPVLRAGSYVRLVVADSGIGMDEATRQRIFEPFFTTKSAGQGTGLGLATVYGIIQQTSGHIDVDSEPGSGTTFSIYLPKASDDSLQVRPTERKTSTADCTETILFVEDEDGVLTFAELVLSRKGYRVLVARDGSEALAIARRHDVFIHLLATDIVMPNMSGPELAEQIAELHPRVRIVFTSGYTEAAIARHVVHGSRIPFIQKPYTAENLVQKVRETLDAVIPDAGIN